jgi:predicted TIM-barrel fold metal-dependent hydrolase
MLDGRPLIDVHLHPAQLDGLKLPWDVWVQDFDSPDLRAMYADRTIDAAAFDAYLEREGVDVAVLLAEYSPKVTGTQAVEHLVAIAAHNPARIAFAANINPHLHYPIDLELERQLSLGAIALKVHPVHAGFAVNDRALYPAYAICEQRGIPLIVHTGTSSFPGALNNYGDPTLVEDVLRDFRGLHVVLAHGGRGWSYDAAAVLALLSDRVWVELSGLPPSRLPTYYARHNWARLCRRMIFGTDWPGTPGIAKNARAVAALCPDEETAGLVLAGNAQRVYRLS